MIEPRWWTPLPFGHRNCLDFHVELILTGESVNGLFRNKVRVIQAVRGYRVSEDAVILTWFARPQPGELVLDAGTGCGVIAFGLAKKEPQCRVVGVEIQEGLAGRASRGVRLNKLEDRVAVVRGDVRHADLFFNRESFDLVISNPPYYQPGRGRISLLHEKALSRHQLMMPLSDLFRTAGILLKENGRLSMIYPASEMGCINKVMKETGFEPARMLWIHPHEKAEAGLVCIEAGMRLSGAKLLEEHLVLYQGPGMRTPEAESIMAGEEIPKAGNCSSLSHG